MSYGYVIDVTAVDRPGIVASVSTAIARIHGNIESCSQTVGRVFYADGPFQSLIDPKN